MADSDFKAFPLYWFLDNALGDDIFKGMYFMAVLIIYILAYKQAMLLPIWQGIFCFVHNGRNRQSRNLTNDGNGITRGS